MLSEYSSSCLGLLPDSRLAQVAFEVKKARVTAGGQENAYDIDQAMWSLNLAAVLSAHVVVNLKRCSASVL